jgi:hypothetical protein
MSLKICVIDKQDILQKNYKMPKKLQNAKRYYAENENDKKKKP